MSVLTPTQKATRKDSDKDYCPENCRWVDALTQAQNKTNNVIIEIDGEKKVLAEWLGSRE
jgi:hypothetical protein